MYSGRSSRIAGQPLGVGELPAGAEHPRHPGDVDAEATCRVADVQVDLGLVAAEPVVLGAGRLERRVERGQVGRLRRVDAAGDDVDGRRARQHRGVDVGAAVEQVLLQGERTHAVTEQHERDARVLGAGPRRQRRHVVDQPAPAGRAEVAVAFSGPRRAPVATVVVGVDDVAGVDQRLGEPAVAGGVLAHPVGDLDDRLRVAVARPAVDEDLLAVAALDRERRLIHRSPDRVDLTNAGRPERWQGMGATTSERSQPPRRRADGAAARPRAGPPARPRPRRRADAAAHRSAARRRAHRRLARPRPPAEAGRRLPPLGAAAGRPAPPAGAGRPPDERAVGVPRLALAAVRLHPHGRRHRRRAGRSRCPPTSSTLARPAVADTFGAADAARTRPTRRSSTSTRPAPASACTRTARSRRRPRSSRSASATRACSASPASTAAPRPFTDVELRSGDLLVFGGADRRIYHGVPKVLDGTGPDGLGLPPGRLSITLRETGL